MCFAQNWAKNIVFLGTLGGKNGVGQIEYFYMRVLNVKMQNFVCRFTGFGRLCGGGIMLKIYVIFIM